MGEYFHVVCHDCKRYLGLQGAKLREIALNIDVAASVGHFAVLHAGHHIELRGDERTYDARIGMEASDAYSQSPPPTLEDADIARAVIGFRDMREKFFATPAATANQTGGQSNG